MPQTRSDIGSFREVFVNSSCLSAKCPFERLSDIVFNSTDLGELEATDGSLWLFKVVQSWLGYSTFTVHDRANVLFIFSSVFKEWRLSDKEREVWMPQRNVTARECWLWRISFDNRLTGFWCKLVMWSTLCQDLVLDSANFKLDHGQHSRDLLYRDLLTGRDSFN